MHCICLNRNPGIYFLLESFDLATIRARLLFEPQRLLTVRLFLCHTECYMQCKMWATWPQQVVHVAQLTKKASLEDTMCIFCFVLLFFCFCYLILRGDPFSQRLLSRGPTESLQVHTHAYSYKKHNNYEQSQTITSYYLDTHTVWSVAGLFFKSFRGAGLGLNPEHPITLAQHHHWNCHWATPAPQVYKAIWTPVIGELLTQAPASTHETLHSDLALSPSLYLSPAFIQTNTVINLVINVCMYIRTYIRTYKC